MSRVIVLDTETTGLVDPEPIEISWLSVDGDPRDMKTSLVTTQKFKPSKPITLAALATHHILDEDLVAFGPPSGFKMPDTEFMVGHNVDYDWGALGKPNVKRICTKALSVALWPLNDAHTLGAMMYCIDRTKARARLQLAHTSAVDVENTVLLLIAIMGKMPLVTTWEKLYEASERARVPKIMPFGKHKGTPMDQVPPDYKAWLLKQPDIDPYLVKAIRESTWTRRY